jgi:hypothetical protein
MATASPDSAERYHEIDVPPVPEYDNSELATLDEALMTAMECATRLRKTRWRTCSAVRSARSSIPNRNQRPGDDKCAEPDLALYPDLLLLVGAFERIDLAALEEVN